MEDIVEAEEEPLDTNQALAQKIVTSTSTDGPW